MDLEKIKTIINSGASNDYKQELIIKILSEDSQVIPKLLKLLEYERIAKKELISDMNLELSRAAIKIELMLENNTIDSNAVMTKEWVLNKIQNFYFKYQSIIKHCFKQKNYLENLKLSDD